MQVDLSKLTIAQLNDLISIAVGELASRASGKTIAKADHPEQNKPAPIKGAWKGGYAFSDADRAKAAAARAANKAGKAAPASTAGATDASASGSTAPTALKRLKPASNAQSFRVRKPSGELCLKKFATAAEAQAWVASWANTSRLSAYQVVAA
jgi:hypothetical protein